MSLLLLDRAAVLTSCSSTQPLCVSLAEAGAPEGTVVWSWEQSAGQGRGDHTWSSPANAGLWISFVLRPSVPFEQWPAFTVLVAAAAAEAIESLVAAPGPNVQIKWPNDLYGKRGKLGGVLAQAVDGGLVFGLGINVWQRDRDFPSTLLGRASSLLGEGWLPESGEIEADRRRSVIAELAVRFDDRLDAAYARFQAEDRRFLRKSILARFYLRDAEVEIEDGRTIHLGRAVDIGPAGELILESGGVRTTVRSGTVLRHGRPSSTDC